MSDTHLCVAALAGAFGVRGEVRLKSFCSNPEDVASYGPLSTEDGSKTYEIKLTRSVKNGFAAKLSGISNKEEADALKGLRLFADRSLLPPLDDDEFYHADLIGLEVFDTGGTSLGKVNAVHDHGAGDLLEILAPGQSSTVLLPFTREAVPTIDIAAGRLIADPPEGLF